MKLISERLPKRNKLQKMSVRNVIVILYLRLILVSILSMVDYKFSGPWFPCGWLKALKMVVFYSEE